MKPRHPIYVISKGRHDCCYTARFLLREGLDFRLVVEPQEVELYEVEFGRARLAVLPFSNLGQGSIPARNWVWEDSIARGARRHWIFDDNILGMWRRWKARKFPCDAAPALYAMEEFVERYENIAIAGPSYYMFAPNRMKCPPFFLNVHVYSSLLIDNTLPFRWRGRYNEDTDLCLQVLSTGKYCTVLFNAFLAWKMTTMTMKGGNSDELYKGDGRLKMARSLERAWPGVVETKRRFQRPQHVVKGNWRGFDTKLVRRSDIDWEALEKQPNEFGMALRMVKPEIKNEALAKLIEERLLADAARSVLDD